MISHTLLQIATEFRERAAVAVLEAERAELLYLAEEYEAVACTQIADIPAAPRPSEQFRKLLSVQPHQQPALPQSQDNL